MDEVSENVDSSNDVVVENTDSSNGEGETSERTYTEYEKQLYARNKVLAKKLADLEGAKKEESTATGLGLDVKGYLKASGIKSSEFDFVQEELKKSGGDIDSLLENEYFQAKLEKHRELAKTADAIPTGKRSGGVPTDSVEYWMSKPIEDVPQSMRREVVNAKLDREKNKGVFYNS